MKSMLLLLLEANVLNSAELSKTLLPEIAQDIPDPYKKIFVKAAFTELMNNEVHHQKVTDLPDDAPSWAQTAFDKGDLVNADINPNFKGELERIVHWISDLIAVAKTTPTDADGKADKQQAINQLNSLNRMNIEAMLQHEIKWWGRHAEKIKGETSGMTKVATVRNNYTWWRLDSQDAYQREGTVLNNCIGRIYTKDLEKQGQYIIVLKDPALESHVAMRVLARGNSMLEVKGMNNRPPAAAYMGYTNEVLQKLGLTVANEGLRDLEQAGYTWQPNKGIMHVSAAYPFSLGPEISGKRQLVEWTAPEYFWSYSFAGPNQVTAGGAVQNSRRVDLVSPKNMEHPMLSFAVSDNRLIAVGNLPNPKYIIKPQSMERMRDTLEEVCTKLGVIPSNELNGADQVSYFNPGLKRYGISVERGRFIADHELAIAMTVRASPESIANIPNPSELLQLEAVKGKPDVVLMIDQPTERVQWEAVSRATYPHKIIDGLLDKLGQDGLSQSVLLAAVKRDGLSLENVQAPSEEVELAAVRQNPHAFSWICYWHSETDRGMPSEKVVAAALDETVHALEDLDNYGFTPSPKMQMQAVDAHKTKPSELRLIKSILGTKLDPRVKSRIDSLLR